MIVLQNQFWSQLTKVSEHNDGNIRLQKKKKLLTWQKAVIENSPEYVVQTEEQLRKMTDILVQNDVCIISESIDIILSIKNPEIKRSRLQIMADRIRHLEKLEPFTAASNKTLLQQAKKLLK